MNLDHQGQLATGDARVDLLLVVEARRLGLLVFLVFLVLELVALVLRLGLGLLAVFLGLLEALVELLLLVRDLLFPVRELVAVLVGLDQVAVAIRDRSDDAVDRRHALEHVDRAAVARDADRRRAARIGDHDRLGELLGRMQTQHRADTARARADRRLQTHGGHARREQGPLMAGIDVAVDRIEGARRRTGAVVEGRVGLEPKR